MFKGWGFHSTVLFFLTNDGINRFWLLLLLFEAQSGIEKLYFLTTSYISVTIKVVESGKVEFYIVFNSTLFFSMCLLIIPIGLVFDFLSIC